ncbi:MAG: hypothetical protein ABJG88_11235 [Litorimonas sp.]
MITFGGISFNWFILLFAVIGVIYALRAIAGYYAVGRDARADYDYKHPQGMIDNRLNEESYIRVYKRVHNPRNLAYIAVTIFSIFALTPVSMIIFEYVFNIIYNLSGQSRVIEPGFLVWQFFIFFFILANCTAIAYLFARHYYRNTPETFLSEIEKQVALNKEA